MAARVEQLGWTAFCEDCDWESEPYEVRERAGRAADEHNEEYHSNDC